MTGEELKQALLAKQPVIFSQADGTETEYLQITAIVYRNKGGRIAVSVEVLDKCNRSVVYCDPKRLRVKGGCLIMFEEAVEGIAKIAAAANPPVAGDYQKDGLLYCGKCHTQKQCRVKNPFHEGQIDIRSCVCKCRQEELAAEKERTERAEKAIEIRRARQAGFPDDEMKNWTFARDDGANKKISEVMRRYVEKFPEMRKNGKGLLLYGPVGTGKTFASACVANALIDKGYFCLMTDFRRLSNTLLGKFEGKQAYIDGLNRFDLLIIDDLAAERDTEYMNEVVQTIVDSRYRAGLPLIVTTNLTGEELKHPADIKKQRTYSRLLEMCIPVEVAGQDRRRKKLTEQYEGYAEMLGL